MPLEVVSWIAYTWDDAVSVRSWRACCEVPRWFMHHGHGWGSAHASQRVTAHREVRLASGVRVGYMAERDTDGARGVWPVRCGFGLCARSAGCGSVTTLDHRLMLICALTTVDSCL